MEARNLAFWNFEFYNPICISALGPKPRPYPHLTLCFLRMSHFLTDRNPAFLTAPVQLNEAAELMGLVLTGEEDRSISSSEMAVVKDILSSSDICIENEANPEKKGISTFDPASLLLHLTQIITVLCSGVCGAFITRVLIYIK